MAFTTTMTTTVSLDDSVKSIYDQSFLVATGESDVMDQFAQYRQEIGAKSILLTKFPRLAPAVTPLTEDADVASTELSDSRITFTPLEYGQAVTVTALADLQSGGQAGAAAVELVGKSAAATSNRLACLALDAATNKLIVNGVTEANLAATDVIDAAFLNKLYNKLARANVATINGSYVAILHDDVINDLRAATGVGSWQDVTKYAMPGEALKNEVGMFKGFRIVRNNLATFGDQSGVGTVDIYNGYFLGANALGLVESLPSQLVMTGPFDKLGRFVNVGWKRVGAYGIVDQDAVWVGQTASSVGNNAA